MNRVYWIPFTAMLLSLPIAAYLLIAVAYGAYTLTFQGFDVTVWPAHLRTVYAVAAFGWMIVWIVGAILEICGVYR